MVVASFGQSESPGNEQRDYWGSEAAGRQGSRNVIGINNPVVDELVEKIIFTPCGAGGPEREGLVAATRALDRVLLWQHYLIPNWHIRYERIAYWNKFGRTGISRRRTVPTCSRGGSIPRRRPRLPAASRRWAANSVAVSGRRPD